MTIPVHDANIDVYQGHDTEPHAVEDPDLVIPAGHIDHVEISARTDDVMDKGSFTLHDIDSRYSETFPLKQADRVEFESPLGESVKYGNGLYGGGIYGGSYTPQWTGRITSVDREQQSANDNSITLKARDYAADILSERKLTNAYIGEDVGSIIRDICRRKAPEIYHDAIPDLGVTTDVKYSSVDCWDAVLRLAARADAIVIPDGQSLHVNQITELPYAFEILDSDMYLPISASTDDDFKNIVRIDSGENQKLEQSQTTVDETNYARVTETNRLTHRLRARKAQVHSVSLFVNTVSDERLVVRLQSDEGGVPIAIEDSDSDIESTSWEVEDLPDPDTPEWVTFFFADHTLADRDPWLIIESGGDEGHDVGQNASGELAYRSYYPHPMNFEVSSRESMREFGPREIRIERENMKTLTAARDAATAELARRAWPSKTVEFEARSQRAHLLAPGDKVDINRPSEDVSGEHIITEVKTTWDSASTVLQADMTAEWRKGVLDPNV